MQLIQLNLNHCRAAQDLFMQTVRDTNAEVAVLSEPYRAASTHGWATDLSGKAALWLCGGGSVQLSDVRSANGFVRGKLDMTWVYSCYLAPSLTLEAFSRIIDELASDIRGRDSVGTQETFNRAGAGSIIDLTYASSTLARQATWRILDLYTASDHEVILVTLAGRALGRTVPPSSQLAYRQDTLRAQAFASALDALCIEDAVGANEAADTLASVVEQARNASMQRRRVYRRQHAPVFWWSENIAALRTACLRARRQVQRARNSSNLQPCSDAYRAARKGLKK
ncbi:hypothetical protein KR032_012145, partial [Drosophila birchii]